MKTKSLPEIGWFWRLLDFQINARKLLSLVKVGIKMPKALDNILKDHFKDSKGFTRGELFDFFCRYEPELTDGTLAWRVYDLKERNVIRPIKRGVYVISPKPFYKPDLSPDLLRVVKQVSEALDGASVCYWDTRWLNEFLQHQINRSALYIEVAKELEEPLFYTLKDKNYREVYYGNDRITQDYYISEGHQPLIIKRLLTRAPVTKRTDRKVEYYTPTLEKLLVDLYTDESLFYYLQGEELVHIFETALNKYSVNFTKLFSYAKRRERERAIKRFLSDHLFHTVKDVLHD